MPLRIWTSFILISIAYNFVCDVAVFAQEIKTPGKSHSYEAVGDFNSQLPNRAPYIKTVVQTKHGLPEEVITGVMKIARDQMSKGDYETAIKILSGTHAPDHIGLKGLLCDAHKEFGDFLLAKGNTEKAIQEYKAAIEVSNSMWRTDITKKQ